MNQIACIVVTYNRLEMLINCINSLRSQSMKEFDIIVVNNGSTDGTKDWLDAQQDIYAIHQENLGGAGGFYAGQKRAYDAGYEWIWMMDDDGIADKEQLKYLYDTSVKENLKFSNALVCNIEDNDKLAFGLKRNGINIDLRSVAQEEMLIDGISPFNGTFIHNSVIETIGFVKKEMFIWGDEVEYSLRARKYGFMMYTITSAIHYHPIAKGKYYNVIPFMAKYRVNVKPKNMSKIFYRNMGYICDCYSPQIKYKVALLHSFFFLSRLKIRELFKFLKYFRRGINNIWEI